MDVLYYLIIARSVTYAQRMQKVLDRAGIVSRVFRAPRELAEGGCAYALQISAKNFRGALQALHREKLDPVRIFLFQRGQYQEIQPGFVPNPPGPPDRPGFVPGPPEKPGFMPNPPDRPGQNPGFMPNPPDRPGQNPGFMPNPPDRPGFVPGPPEKPGFMPGISVRPWEWRSGEGKA